MTRPGQILQGPVSLKRCLIGLQCQPGVTAGFTGSGRACGQLSLCVSTRRCDDADTSICRLARWLHVPSIVLLVLLRKYNASSADGDMIPPVRLFMLVHCTEQCTLASFTRSSCSTQGLL